MRADSTTRTRLQVLENLVALLLARTSAGGTTTPNPAVTVSTAGTGGAKQGTAAAPYAMQPADRYIMFDADSAVTQVAAELPVPPVVGERHTFWSFQWSGAGNPPPLITAAGGKMMTPYAPGAPTTGQVVATTTITAWYAFFTLEWNGVDWIQVG